LLILIKILILLNIYLYSFIYTIFSKYNSIFPVFVGIIVFFLVSNIIFIIINIKKEIIDDIGCKKLILLTFGLILYYLSHLFSAYTNYTECALNISFKHLGLSLTVIICYLMIIINYELGKTNNSGNRNITVEDEPHNEPGDDEDLQNNTLNNTKTVHSINIKNSFIKVKGKGKEMSIKNDPLFEINEGILKKMKSIKSLHVESIFVYFLFVMGIVVSTIHYHMVDKNNQKMNKNITQNNKGEWYYKCKLETLDLICSLIEFVILLIIFIRSQKLLNYNQVFKYTIYISIAVKIEIFLGPILNVSKKKGENNIFIYLYYIYITYIYFH